MRRLEIEPLPAAIADSIEKDTGGRNDEIVDFVRVLSSVEGPYSILLDAPWGDGKTFFVKSIIQVIKSMNPQIGLDDDINASKLNQVTAKLKNIVEPMFPFYFNAWENDFSEDPLSALLASMAVEFDQIDKLKEISKKKVISSIIDASLGTMIGLRVSKVVEAIDGESLIEAYAKRTTIRASIDKLAGESLPEVANRLVIFIDELDRCRPDFAVRLLEQVKTLFQSDRIVVIMVADSVQLAHAVGGAYGVGFDTPHFIERFFDLRLTLSPSNPYAIIHGCPQQRTSHRFDELVREIMDKVSMTIRDFMRVEEKLRMARGYCDMPDNNSMSICVAKCAILPVLIFLEREQPNAFRKIVRGADFDIVYEYGSEFVQFNEIVRSALVSTKSSNNENKITSESCRQYIHNLCILIYGSQLDWREQEKAKKLVGIDHGYFDPAVFKSLRFDSHED